MSFSPNEPQVFRRKALYSEPIGNSNEFRRHDFPTGSLNNPRPESVGDRKSSWPSKLRHALVASAIILSALWAPLHPSLAADGTNGLPIGKKYWTIVEAGEPHERIAANTALMDYAVGTINTMFYDKTGGVFFQPSDFYKSWKNWLKEVPDNMLETRTGVVEGLEWLVSQLNDPFSRYLTREQLKAELMQPNYGFLGLGAIVESPQDSDPFFGSGRSMVIANPPPGFLGTGPQKVMLQPSQAHLLSAEQISKLPFVSAVSPDSPAERAGLVVGDRIVAVADENFLKYKAAEAPRLVRKYSSAENYLGYPELTIAKPVYASVPTAPTSLVVDGNSFVDVDASDRQVIVAYRTTRVRLPTVLTAETAWSSKGDDNNEQQTVIQGGNAVVHYELLNSQRTLFDLTNIFGQPTDDNELSVGYIRLTRFSRSATAGFVDAVEQLERAGAKSYIIDLRNNYGGVIQEAMMTASTLLRDPHAVLCYTLNSRGGFTPHDVEEFALDKQFPGYLMSSEPTTALLKQIMLEKPEMFRADGVHWVPPSSYASLREQRVKRGIHPAHLLPWENAAISKELKAIQEQRVGQKDLVVLVNEGTASAAEVFASALHDNGRTVALVGTKTFGKGLIQHTFPMPDGGGLRLTVAEYLTPSLHHVTKVGNARFDPASGEWVGGGIQPDIVCESRQGIPRNVGADLCVGVALDALEGAAIERKLGLFDMTN